MNRIQLTVILFTIAGCPQDDAPANTTETLIETSTVSPGDPDLPADTSTSGSSFGTTSVTTGDGDGDSTGDGDGDTGSGDGDGGPGDGDGDTGSEAVPASLIVESNGQRIGYLMGVWDYGFIVWDDLNEVSFQLNQQTGHVAGSPGPSGYYATPDCTGTRYEQAVYVPIEMCNQIAAPTRRYVRGENVLGGGHIAAPNLAAIVGEPLVVNVQSLQGNMVCQPFMTQLCMFAVQATNVIPVTFQLPITVAETLAMP